MLTSSQATQAALAHLRKAAADQAEAVIVAAAEGRQQDAAWSRHLCRQIQQLAETIEADATADGFLSVSYTHLTLPTKA